MREWSWAHCCAFWLRAAHLFKLVFFFFFKSHHTKTHGTLPYIVVQDFAQVSKMHWSAIKNKWHWHTPAKGRHSILISCSHFLCTSKQSSNGWISFLSAGFPKVTTCSLQWGLFGRVIKEHNWEPGTECCHFIRGTVLTGLLGINEKCKVKKIKVTFQIIFFYHVNLLMIKRK